MPPLGQIPAASGYTAAQQQTLNSWAAGFNKALQSEATMLSASLGVQIHIVNVQGLFQQVMANPANFGFTNVTGSAINSSPPHGTWDQEHPTTATDAIIAEVAAQSVPEPSMFLVFAVSIGGVAASIKLRGRTVAA